MKLGRKSDYAETVIKPGDEVSKLAKKVSRASFKNAPAIEVIERKGLRGLVGINWAKHILKEMLKDKMYMIPQNDGDGHKPGVFTLLHDPAHFFNLGWEVIEMCIEDIVRYGGLPVALLANQIDFKKITKANLPYIKILLAGFQAALKKAGIANYTGETAGMKLAITAFCYNSHPAQLILTWTATAIGLGHKEKEIDGSKIEPGMPIIGFREPGGRCNGYTKLIELGMRKWGPTDMLSEEARAYFRELAIPSANYSRTITRVHGWLPDGRIRKPDVDIAGIAHITGGGIWEKFGEILPKGIGAMLTDMPKPPKALTWAQILSQAVGDENLTPITDLDAHGDFHGGCGMMVIVRSDKDAHLLIEEATKDGIDASIVGTTTRSPINEILIRSRFKEGRMLSSEELKR